MRIAVGLASGLGNCVFMLPTIVALKLMGHEIALYVQTDFPTADLWRKCRYADVVLEPPASLDGYKLICGQWRPAAWSGRRDIARYQIAHPYRMSEWESNFRLARDLDWKGDAPDVKLWCRGIDRTPRWDVGIAPGCKGGTWLRKRYPGMAGVAQSLIDAGKSVAVFGKLEDGVKDVPGTWVEADTPDSLPGVLSGCKTFVGTDSGITHLACSLGIPTVVVHTASCPVKAKPVGRSAQVFTDLPCRPCQSTPRWNACVDWKCRNVRTDIVIETLRTMEQ